MGSRYSGPCSCLNGQSYQGCQIEKTLKGMALTAGHFFRRQKVTKRLGPGVRPLAGARGSFVPGSIRGHRFRFASLHLLSMCSTSSNGAARLPPDQSLHSACRRGQQIKSCSRANAHPVEWLGAGEGAFDLFRSGLSRRRSSPRQLGQSPLPLGEG